MPVGEQEQTEQDAGGIRKKALAAVAAAAATGAATYAVQKATSHDNKRASDDRTESAEEEERDEEGTRRSTKATSALSSMASSVRQLSGDVMVPVADEAAAAAGRFVAEHAPEIVRDRLVPRFIESFNDAR